MNLILIKDYVRNNFHFNKYQNKIIMYRLKFLKKKADILI